MFRTSREAPYADAPSNSATGARYFSAADVDLLKLGHLVCRVADARFARRATGDGARWRSSEH